MKSIFLLILTVLLVSVNVCSASDLKEGFLGTRWAQSADSLVGFSKVRENGKTSYYINPGRVYEINGRMVPHVVYGFFEGHLFGIYIRIDDDELFADVKDHLLSKYGTPAMKMEMKRELKTLQWKYDLIKIKLKSNPGGGPMKLAIYFTPLSKKINEELQEKFYDRSFKLFPIDKDRRPETYPSIPLLNF